MKKIHDPTFIRNVKHENETHRITKDPRRQTAKPLLTCRVPDVIFFK